MTTKVHDVQGAGDSGTPATPARGRPWSAGTRALRSNHVAQAAAALIAVHLGYRAWVTAVAWFNGDDFAFMSRMMNDGPSPSVAAQPYGGHLMPAGMYLSWLANAISPYDWTVTGAMLLAMQALADIGLVVLLVRLFGLRAGILPPLALYLFCVISTPVAIWWAAAVNQIPLQVALFWGLAAHVSYLRTRRTRHLLVSLAWVLVGLAFYEKTILVLGAFGIVTLSYFATGSFANRLRAVWDDYRGAAVLYLLLGAGYVGVYASFALNFEPSGGNKDALGDVVSNMVFQAYVPAVVGGPLHWKMSSQSALPAPGAVTLLASLAAIFWVLREIHRSRRRSLRAWWLPVFFLGCDVVLVLAGRVSFVGAVISLEYRYQGELAAVTAVALALATMPVRGAVEPVEPVARPGSFLAFPERVAAATAVVSVLGLVSSTQYAWHWSTSMEGKPYFTHLLSDLETADGPVALVDEPVPDFIMWQFSPPLSQLSHVLRPYADRTRFVTVSTDDLSVVSRTGNIRPAGIPPVRRSEPGPIKGCGYRISTSSKHIPLNGPVAYGGWWVRIAYYSDGYSPVTVTTGGVSRHTTVRAGLHALYLKGDDDFDSVTVSGLADGVTVCATDVAVGRPEPVKVNQ